MSLTSDTSLLLSGDVAWGDPAPTHAPIKRSARKRLKHDGLASNSKPLGCWDRSPPGVVVEVPFHQPRPPDRAASTSNRRNLARAKIKGVTQHPYSAAAKSRIWKPADTFSALPSASPVGNIVPRDCSSVLHGEEVILRVVVVFSGPETNSYPFSGDSITNSITLYSSTVVGHRRLCRGKLKPTIANGPSSTARARQGGTIALHTAECTTSYYGILHTERSAAQTRTPHSFTSGGRHASVVDDGIWKRCFCGRGCSPVSGCEANATPA